MMSTLPLRHFREQEMDDDGHGKDSKDSKASSDEGSSADPPRNAGGRRRPYYECTFCKRGFSNAQALGGHMNIHRRDRRPPAVPAPEPLVRDTAAADGYAYGYYFGQYASSYDAAAVFYQPATYYAAYLPASPAGQGARARADGGVRAAAYEMSLFGGEELRGERVQEVEEGEVDLELRLGHRP